MGRIELNSSEQAISSLFTRLWKIIGKRRRLQLYALVILMVCASIAEVFSIGAVIPFLGVLLSPDSLLSYPYIAEVIGVLGLHDQKDIILAFAVLFVCAALISGLMRFLFLVCSTKLAFALGADIRVGVFGRVLNQSYSAHVARNTSEVISTLTTKTNQVVRQIINPVLSLIGSILMILVVALALFFIDPVITLASVLTIGGVYILVFYFFRKKVGRNGVIISRNSSSVIQTIQEGLGGIRDVILENAQDVYCRNYRRVDIPLLNAQVENLLFAQAPRYLIEATAIVLIALIAYSLSLTDQGFAGKAPLLGAFVLGAQKLLPLVQQAYSSWSSIQGSRASLADVLDLYEQEFSGKADSEEKRIIVFEDSIKFHGVSFHYERAESKTLEEVDIEIPRGSRVGIVGESGSGKSTLVDMLMGLLVPTQGRITVDGEELAASSILSWRRKIAHVPQHIYLMDATIAENIAFGIELDEIDQNRLELAIRQSVLQSVVDDLPNGINTRVGERGVKISGGQLQRIGIARALYKQPDILILDEATSALDTETENQLMDNLGKADQSMTIVAITHRTSTLKHSDRILNVTDGTIKNLGSYTDMMAPR